MIWALARDLGKFPHEIEAEMEAWELVEYAALLQIEGREMKRAMRR